MTKIKELKIYGYLMIFFGVLDLLYMLLDISEINADAGNYPSIVVTFAYIFLGVCMLMTLAKFWMGRQALCYAKGKGKGTSHILLAKIGIVFCILALVVDGYAFFNGTSSITELCSTGASLMVMCSYYQAAKACL